MLPLCFPRTLDAISSAWAGVEVEGWGRGGGALYMLSVD